MVWQRLIDMERGREELILRLVEKVGKFKKLNNLIMFEYGD